MVEKMERGVRSVVFTLDNLLSTTDSAFSFMPTQKPFMAYITRIFCQTWTKSLVRQSLDNLCYHADVLSCTPSICPIYTSSYLFTITCIGILYQFILRISLDVTDKVEGFCKWKFSRDNIYI